MANYNDIINNKIDSLRRRIAVLSRQASSTEVTYYSRKTVLTDAQIKALPTTPVELVPAPGADKLLVFHGALFNRPALSAAYTGFESGDMIAVGYDGVTDLIDNGFLDDIGIGATMLSHLLTGNPSQRLLLQDAPKVTPMSGGYCMPVDLTANGNAVNKALTVLAFTGNGNFTGGHASNTLEVTVFYSIVDL